MANTPIDEGLGRDCKRPSFRCPEFLLDYVEQFREDYNAVIGEISEDDDEVERLTLDSRSEAFRRLMDIGLGAWYSDNVLMFAAPPGHNVCTECGESGEKVRIGIIPGEPSYVPESKLCLSCGSEEDLQVDDEPDDTEVADDPFDGVEA